MKPILSLLIALSLIGTTAAQRWAPDQNIDNVLPITFNLHDSFGAVSDADSAPSYRVYEMTTSTPILTGTLSTFDASNTDGFYDGSITLSAANGFEVGKTYKLRVQGTVDTVTGADVTLFRVISATENDVPTALDDFYANTLAQRFNSIDDATATIVDVFPDTIDAQQGDVTGTLADVHAVGGDALVITDAGDLNIDAYFDFSGIDADSADNFRIRIKADLEQGARYDIIAYNSVTDSYETVADFEADGHYYTVDFSLSANQYTGGSARIGINEAVALNSSIYIDYLRTRTLETTAELSSTAATNSSTTVTRLTSQRAANLDNLDAAVSEVGSGTADARDLMPTDHTWQLRRSGDGAWRSTNKCIVHAGDTVRIAWNCDVPGLLPGGTVIATQGTPELVTASDDIAITTPDIGHDAKNAKVEIEIEADAVAGTHWLKTQFTPTGASGPKTVYGEIEIQEEPE